MVKVVVNRKLEYANRVAVQQADQAIRKDVVRALVEFITNSNDSYQRLEDSGHRIKCSIAIDVERHHSDSIIRVYDNAEGIDGKELDAKVGIYGGDTSGFRQGKSVRGMWGRGLKDAIFGLGKGSIISVKDGYYHFCGLEVKKGQPNYQREAPIRANDLLAIQYNLPEKSGTRIEVTVTRNDVRVPQFDTLRRQLEHHYELRSIMSNPKREVLLRELDSRGKLKQEVRLGYKFPVGEKVLEESFAIADYPATATLALYRAKEPLSTPAENGDYADGGLVIISKNVILSLSSLKYENNEFASHLYGQIQCDYFHDLLKKDDAIATATRDGINWRHPFCKALKSVVESKIDPIIERERRAAQNKGQISRKLRDQLDQAMKALNDIANAELGKVEQSGHDTGEGGKKAPKMPVGGFGFVPEYASIQSGKVAGLILRVAIPDIAEPGNLVSFTSSGDEVKVLTPQSLIYAKEGYSGVGEARVELEGRQVGGEAIITAKMGDREAEAFVKVVSKPGVKEPKPPRPHGGLIDNIVLDPNLEPKQRVQFRRADAVVLIATKAPSVSPYIGPNGEGHESPEAQVLLAELVTEAVCREIARRGVETQKFVSFADSVADAIQAQYNRLQNQYAHLIHACFRASGAGPERKGRAPRDVALAEATVEL